MRGIPQFAANPGGAPANLAGCGLQAHRRLYRKVGEDAFGRYLKEVLAENKVDVSAWRWMVQPPHHHGVVS